jgi:hypothetical protein
VYGVYISQLKWYSVPNSVIAWTEISCWRKSYSNTTALLIVMKYPYLKWQWIFSFLRRFFFPLPSTRLLSYLAICMSHTAGYFLLLSSSCGVVCPMLPVSLDCLHPVGCVPNVASVSGLSSSCGLCAQCCQCLWIFKFLIVPSVFFNVYCIELLI